MPSSLIYLDTSIWNALCDQKTPTKELCSALDQGKAQFVLGENVVHELMKTFGMKAGDAERRGRELFSCLRQFVAGRVRLAKGNGAVLLEEAQLAAGRSTEVEPFYDAEASAQGLAILDDLTCGRLPYGTDTFLSERKSSAVESRAGLRDYIEGMPEIREVLSAVKPERLDDWLQAEMVSFQGRRLLRGHLESIGLIVENGMHMDQIVSAMLSSIRFRSAQAFVRNDLYFNWRCVSRGSVRGDHMDDSYHAIAASYCDVFVTTEKDQANVAGHVVPSVRRLVYDGSEPILTWLPQQLQPIANCCS
jgi:hypothetical protein